MGDAADATVSSTEINGNGAGGGAGRLRKFLKAAIQLEASDLIIRPEIRAKLRIRGALRDLEAPVFTDSELRAELDSMMTPRHRQELAENGSVDLAYAYDADNRFRVNIFKSLERPSFAARRISSQIQSYEDLHLPPVLGAIAREHQGLVLLCGVTGSGKSTSIASMLQQINQERACHIVTLEDPVEFIFKDARATVSQRELGIDVPDYSTGLRALVRENPDVVLIGELRDRETFEAAIQAAETGHLVFGTVHASSVFQCFGRIYNLFPPEERDLIRTMFALNMKALVYQKLLKSIKPEIQRVPAVEVLLNTPIVQKYILESREVELPEVLKKSQGEGMIEYHSWLVEMVNKEYIHPKTALEVARSQDELRMKMKGIG